MGGIQKKIRINPNEENFDNRNVLKDSSIRIPNWWGDVTKEGKTNTQLKQKKKELLRHHSSFDLDGDGYIGERDLVIASKFDLDKDGKLNDQEREAAMEAVRKVC
jgi:hypothetical protein